MLRKPPEALNRYRRASCRREKVAHALPMVQQDVDGHCTDSNAEDATPESPTRTDHDICLQKILALNQENESLKKKTNG